MIQSLVKELEKVINYTDTTILSALYNTTVKNILLIVLALYSIFVVKELPRSIIELSNKVEVRSTDSTPGRVDLFCEVSNAHYARLQAPFHSAFSGNVVATLPTKSGNLIVGDSAVIDNDINTSGIITASSFSGSGSNLTSLTGASAGSYGGGFVIPVITVDANGRITGISTAANAGAQGGGGGIANVVDDTAPQLGGTLDTNGNLIQFGDSSSATDDRLQFGASQDLQIYHDGSHSYILDNGTGDLRLSGNVVKFNNQSNTATMVKATQGGSVELNYDNSKKLETTTTGAKVTGSVEVTQEYPSIRPTLDLNFAATKVLDNRITFTRDGVGTYVDDMGIIKYASNNTPRFDHDLTTGESLGLLIEESRTNTLTYSSNHQQDTTHNFLAGYTQTTHTKVTNVDPPVIGDEVWIIEDAAANNSYAIKSDNTTATGYISYSIFVKRYNSDTFGIGSHFGSSVGTFNLANGTFTNGSTYGTQMIAYPNGWYKITWTRDYSSDNKVTGMNIQPSTGNGVYVSGIQIEVGAFPTSYIPTSGSTVTRAQDFVSITGTNFTDFYNNIEGSLYSEFILNGLDGAYNNTSVMINNNTENEYIAIFGHNPAYAWVQSSGGTSFGPSLGSSTTTGTNYKVAMSYKLNDFAATLNGGSVSIDTSGVVPTVDRMFIGRRYAVNTPLKGTIKKLTYYNKKLSDAQLQSLTRQ